MCYTCTIANTYDWMTATAAYRINERICVVFSTVSKVCLIDGPLLPYLLTYLLHGAESFLRS